MTAPVTRRFRIEDALLRAVGRGLCRLPYRMALGVGWVIAAVTYVFMAGRRREARRRIGEVFGATITGRRARQIAWASWRNTVFTAVEVLRLPCATREWAERVTEYADSLRVLTGYRAAGGAILALPHMGSWELAAATVRYQGLPLFSIAADQKNPLFNAHMNELRQSTGMPIILRGRGMLRDVIRRLKAGELLAILPDLRQRTPGVQVPFLGRQANLAEGMGTLAMAAQVPVIPCYVTREGWCRHRFHVLEPVFPQPGAARDAEVERITRAVMAALERVIRAQPEQWFWYNRRWVLQPLDPQA